MPPLAFAHTAPRQRVKQERSDPKSPDRHRHDHKPTHMSIFPLTAGRAKHMRCRGASCSNRLNGMVAWQERPVPAGAGAVGLVKLLALRDGLRADAARATPPLLPKMVRAALPLPEARPAIERPEVRPAAHPRHDPADLAGAGPRGEPAARSCQPGDHDDGLRARAARQPA